MLYLAENGWRQLQKDRLVLAFNHPRAPRERLAGRRRPPWFNFAEARPIRHQSLRRGGPLAGRNWRPGVCPADRRQHRRRRAVVRPVGDHGLTAQQAVAHADELTALPKGTLAGRCSAESGFSIDALLIVTEQDILGDRLTRTVTRKRKTEVFLAELANCAGDFVVHADHGIGRYDGLETLCRWRARTTAAHDL